MFGKDSPETHFAWFAALGVGIGLGKLLASKQRLTLRVVIGRALVTGGLATSGHLLILAFPQADFWLQFAAAGLLASLGTSLIEKIITKAVGSDK
jgi:hypothetical protein